MKITKHWTPKHKESNFLFLLLGIATVYLFALNVHLLKISQQIKDETYILEAQYKDIRLQNKMLEHFIHEFDMFEIKSVPAPEKPTVNSWKGTASYYSVAGCVGCREDLLMANGKKFDENAMTLAFNWLPLNTPVKVTNPKTNITIEAVVTDTGGFNELGRIADLSKGLKEALGCSDLCEVEVTQ